MRLIFSWYRLTSTNKQKSYNNSFWQSVKSARNKRYNKILFFYFRKVISSFLRRDYPLAWRTQDEMSQTVFQARLELEDVWSMKSHQCTFKGQVYDYRSPVNATKRGVYPSKEPWNHSSRRYSAEARARSKHLHV